MAPGVFDLDLYRGDSYAWSFRVWDDCLRSIPADLEGSTAEAEIRDRPAGATVVPLSCSITPPNVIDVVLDPSLWATIPVGGVWDLQVTSDVGGIRTIVAGKVLVTPDVTDSTP
jgi:hypothetical protein